MSPAVREVRFHGRGGQGVVLAAQMLAVAAVHDGGHAVAFPTFGPERRGAPVVAHTRFSPTPLRRRSSGGRADAIVVFDESLLGAVDVASGLAEDGVVVVNSTRRPEALSLSAPASAATVDATSIALERTGHPAVNAALIGALARATDLVSLGGITAGIQEVLGPRLGADGVGANLAASVAAFGATHVGRAQGGRQFTVAERWLPGVLDLPPGLAVTYRETPQGAIGPGSSLRNRTGSWRVNRPVLDADRCTNCLLCWLYCPDGSVLRTPHGVALRYDYCKGCGICAAVCTPGAIEMMREVVA